MQKTKRILAAAILGLIATAGYSQAQVTLTASPTPVASPTPDPRTGTYQDPKLSVPQRIQLANTALGSGTDASSIYNPASFMLTARPVINLVNAFPQFDAQVLADPTLSGTLGDPDQISALYAAAVNFKVATIPALADEIAYLQPLVSSTLFTPNMTLAMQNVYANLVCQAATVQMNAGNYSGAITTVAPVLGWNGTASVLLTLNAKVATRSADVLSWAKLVYEAEDFQHTQAGIDAVSSAFRSLDTNLVRANAFIQYQKDGQGANPLANVALPQVTFLGWTPGVQAINAGVSGDNLTALKIAVNAFATAPSGAPLNTATAFVAQWLRNIDGNLVRANAFVNAQSQGITFTISELQAFVRPVEYDRIVSLNPTVNVQNETMLVVSVPDYRGYAGY